MLETTIADFRLLRDIDDRLKENLRDPVAELKPPQRYDVDSGAFVH